MFVVVVWFCRSSSLAFLISAYLINLMHHFFPAELFALEAIFSFIHQFFWNTPVFLSVTHLVDSYSKIVDEWGRNLMCDRTLPSCLVVIIQKIEKTVNQPRFSLFDFAVIEYRRHQKARMILWVAEMVARYLNESINET